MDSSLTALAAFHASQGERGVTLVLATIVATTGSTYRKPGGKMLFSATGESCGLLSGGCMESDLLEHARHVMRENKPGLVDYDLRESSDPIWGLGSGCEGGMRIFLQPLARADGYRPFSVFAEVLRTRRPLTYATVIRSTVEELPPGTTFIPGEQLATGLGRTIAALCAEAERAGEFNQVLERSDLPLSLFVGLVVPPPRVLVLGGGPDAVSVVNQAVLLGWSVTVVDHRPAYATASRFPGAERVLLARPEELRTRLDLASFDGAVVMSHHLQSDTEYLRCLSATSLDYIGLLGPAARRERLHADLGADAQLLQDRLYGPVGLNIGATTPEGIALAIVAEIHAVLSGRPGNSFSSPIPFGVR